MTTKEHVYAVRKLLSPRASDDFEISLPFIAHLLKVTRAILIQRRQAKYERITEDAYQSVTINLIPATCGVGSCGLRSEFPIPNLLESKRGSSLKVVDGMFNEIPRLTFTRAKLKESLDKPKTPYFYILNNHLFLYHSDLTQVTLIGLFDEVVNTCQSTTEFCDPLDTKFPIDTDLVQPMYHMVLELLYNTQKIPKDNANDAQDNTKINAVP